MHYSKIIKLASYFKSSGNKETYFQLLKIASEDRFEGLVNGSYPSGEKNERGEYDRTILNEASSKRNMAVRLINNKQATISDLVKIINRNDRFISEDNLTKWSEGLNQEYVEELKSMLFRPTPNEPRRDSGQSRGSPSAARPVTYSWEGMSAATILSRLSGVVLYHEPIFKAIKVILGKQIFYPSRERQSDSMFSFFSNRVERNTDSGYIVNYSPERKRVRIKTGMSFTYAELDINLLNLNITEEMYSPLSVLISKDPFTIKIPRPGGYFSDGFLIGAYEIEGGFELVTAWPSEEGEERDALTRSKRINTFDPQGLDAFFLANRRFFLQ